MRLLLLGLAPAALVFLQPDLGTALVLRGRSPSPCCSSPGSLDALRGDRRGSRRRGHARARGRAGGRHCRSCKGYQEERLTSFLHPSDDPSDAGYQTDQALIAIGSGEKTGRGDDATQTRLDFVPERHTDFIFAVIGERYGFVGAAFVLSLYALLIWRALRIVTLSKNLYGTLSRAASPPCCMFQVFVNVGMNLGIMPITGIPLPLMSYGGSSVLATFLAIGLLQSIHVQARLSAREGRSRSVR